MMFDRLSGDYLRFGCLIAFRMAVLAVLACLAFLVLLAFLAFLAFLGLLGLLGAKCLRNSSRGSRQFSCYPHQCQH